MPKMHQNTFKLLSAPPDLVAAIGATSQEREGRGVKEGDGVYF